MSASQQHNINQLQTKEDAANDIGLVRQIEPPAKIPRGLRIKNLKQKRESHQGSFRAEARRSSSHWLVVRRTCGGAASIFALSRATEKPQNASVGTNTMSHRPPRTHPAKTKIERRSDEVIYDARYSERLKL